MIQQQRIETAIHRLRADITAAVAMSIRGGLTPIEAMLIAQDIISTSMRERLGEGWVASLVGISKDEKSANAQ